jgi:hypothetical protein
MTRNRRGQPEEAEIVRPLCLIAPDGTMSVDNLSPESFCGGLRQPDRES